MPMARMTTVYCPPAVGEEQRVLPLLVGGLGALEPVSTLVTSTRAPAIGCPEARRSVPVMMSVVLPTCAAAVAASVAPAGERCARAAG
jgi:hypothetical protein